MYHVIILAAGRGTRLGALNHPKALTPLSETETILSRQLYWIEKYIPHPSITLVVGYEKEKIISLYPQYHYVINENFAAENTAKSLLKALYVVEGDVLWLNGDVVFSPHVLPRLIANPITSILVNTNQTSEEEVKYRANAEQFIIE